MAWLSSYGDTSKLRWMFELPMTAFCCNQIPFIFQELIDKFVHFHWVILPKCEEKSNFSSASTGLGKGSSTGSLISRLCQVGTRLLSFLFYFFSALRSLLSATRTLLRTWVFFGIGVDSASETHQSPIRIKAWSIDNGLGVRSCKTVFFHLPISFPSRLGSSVSQTCLSKTILFVTFCFFALGPRVDSGKGGQELGHVDFFITGWQESGQACTILLQVQLGGRLLAP